MLFDTHCHLDDEKYVDQKLIVDSFINDGGYAMINMGVNEISSEIGQELSKKFDCVYFATGFHPSDVFRVNDDSFFKVENLTTDEKCVAVGEIGLDFHFEPFDKSKQIELFERQIELAYKSKLPFSIHSRDATLDTISVLQRNKNKLQYGATMHCFSGSKETAKILLDLGLYISFGGTVTFKNATNIQEVACFVPVDRILTETDSPYLAPTPFRGSLNQPKNVKLVLEFLANLRKINFQDFSKIVEDNTFRLFSKIKK